MQLVNAMDEYYFLSASAASSLGNERAAQGIRSDFVGILSKNPGALRVWNARQSARIERLEAFGAVAPTGRPYWIDSIRSELQELN